MLLFSIVSSAFEDLLETRFTHRFTSVSCSRLLSVEIEVVSNFVDQVFAVVAFGRRLARAQFTVKVRLEEEWC